jgi:hypothetical protein
LIVEEVAVRERKRNKNVERGVRRGIGNLTQLISVFAVKAVYKVRRALTQAQKSNTETKVFDQSEVAMMNIY